MGSFLQRGESKEITLYLNGKSYKAHIYNVNFDSKFNRNKDTLQIRYPRNGDFSKALQICFASSYKYIESLRAMRLPGDRTIIKVPEEYKEYLAIYTTEYDDSYVLETIEANDIGNHNSLSDSVSDVEQIVKIGYIHALEFQKPKVEGVLINNLRDLPSHLSLLSGSDCHQWNEYPYHDEKNKNTEFHHSKAKILPTFKGLLMAITSPETRFNCKENTNPMYIDGFEINGKKISLINGINTIIGENGSGKSTILKLLSNSTKESYVKEIITKNGLKVDNTIDNTRVKYIKQGDIINKFNDNKLFLTDTEDNFMELDNYQFIDAYFQYSQAIKKVIKNKIEENRLIDALKNNNITYEQVLENKSYYVNATVWFIEGGL